MNAPPSAPTPPLANQLDTTGWAVVPNFLDPAECRRLAGECLATWDDGGFRRAGVGRGEQRAIREDIRRDHVCWLDEATATPAQQRYLARLDELRLEINRRLFLGLFAFEGHFAIYPPGGFYKAHLDRHQGTLDRVVTAILYLNEDWHEDDGGQLQLWTTPGAKDGPFEQVEPRLGTLVTFLAGDHWHEVLPARRERMSITGWFRVRGPG